MFTPQRITLYSAYSITKYSGVKIPFCIWWMFFSSASIRLLFFRSTSSWYLRMLTRYFWGLWRLYEGHMREPVALHSHLHLKKGQGARILNFLSNEPQTNFQRSLLPYYEQKLLRIWNGLCPPQSLALYAKVFNCFKSRIVAKSQTLA